MNLIYVPFKFKKNLDDRFNPSNAVRVDKEYYSYYEIPIACQLCLEYHNPKEKNPNEICKGCPFSSLHFIDKKKRITYGCEAFIKDLVPELYKLCVFFNIERIWWVSEQDTEVVKALNKLRKEAMRYIKFV